MDRTQVHPATDMLPEDITKLPKVEVPVAGVTGYALQDDQKQLVFFLFDEGVSFPDHAHCEQRGLVISGEMVMEVDGEPNYYQAGDQYVVPEGVSHRASFSQPTLLIDMSDKPDRFTTTG